MKEHLEKQVIGFLDDLTSPEMYGFAVSREVVERAMKLREIILIEKVIEKERFDYLDSTITPGQWEEYIAEEEAKEANNQDMTERQHTISHAWVKAYEIHAVMKGESPDQATKSADAAVDALNKKLGE